MHIENQCKLRMIKIKFKKAKSQNQLGKPNKRQSPLANRSSPAGNWQLPFVTTFYGLQKHAHIHRN